MRAEPDGVDGRGYYCVTNTGSRWYPHDPRAEDFDVRHVLAIANVPRFAGATPKPYSAMQHSLRVVALVHQMSDGLGADERKAAMWAALVHDAAECYWPGDVPSPMKRACVELAILADRRDAVVAECLRFDRGHELVKQADAMAFGEEWSWVIGDRERYEYATLHANRSHVLGDFVDYWRRLRPKGVASL